MTTDLFLGLSPLLVVAGGALVLMLVEAFTKLRDERVESPSASLAASSAVVLFSSAMASMGLWLYGPDKLEVLKTMAPYMVIDRFSLFFFVILTLGAGLSCLLAGGYLPEHKLDRGEFYPLLLLSTAGAMALVAATDMLTIFIGLEGMSLGVYAMVAFRRGSPRAVEASLKYFLLGSFAAAILLYGGALIYGATGRTDLEGIGAQLAKTGSRLPPPDSIRPEDLQLIAYDNALPLIVAGLVLILIGLAFKVSAVPFHMWTPDAYEGAPTPVTTYMAVAVKAAAFAMMLRVLLIAFGDAQSASWGSGWPPVLATLAVATMTIANVIAGRQESVKRMLAYSSIAHAGYLLIAMVAATRAAEEAEASIIFYLLVYTVSTAGAFGTLIWCGSRGAEAVSYDDLAGLGRRHPVVAFTFSLFLLSLAGMPPLAGFFGKFYLFKVTIESGFVQLAVIGLLNSVIAAYYYLRVMVYMYMKESEPGAPIARPMSSGYVSTALLISAILVVLLGLLPSGTLDAAILAVK